MTKILLVDDSKFLRLATERALAVVAFTGLSHKNASRLEHDGACAFLDKAELGKGSEALLVALARIIRSLKLEVPAGVVK